MNAKVMVVLLAYLSGFDLVSSKEVPGERTRNIMIDRRAKLIAKSSFRVSYKITDQGLADLWFAARDTKYLEKVDVTKVSRHIAKSGQGDWVAYFALLGANNGANYQLLMLEKADVHAALDAERVWIKSEEKKSTKND